MVGPTKNWRVRDTWIAIAAAWLVCGAVARAGDWPIYRGLLHNGISDEVDWRSDWGDVGPKVLWRATVGTGSSSVVTAGGRAYTMGNHGEEEGQQEDTVYCFDAETGATLWNHTYPCPLLPKYYEGGTLSTPTVDGGVVYVLSKMGDLLCLQAATGQVLWERQLNRKLGLTLPTWHFSGSPLVVEDKLILNVGSAGVALNKHTGEVIWENGKEACGYATPVPATIDGHECVVLCGADSVIGVRIGDGEVLWRYPFFNKHKATTADAIVRGDEVFASCAYGRGCAKIRIAGGQVTRVFDNRVMRNLQSCSVLWQGCLYGFDENRLKCIDFRDGRELWSEIRMGKGSLSMCADGRMLVMSDRGELVIARATEVTQKEWLLIMGTSPGYFKGGDLPVERVTWCEAVEFCQRLSEKEKKRYRLPSEAEWEYACRAGTTTAYYTGGNDAALAAAGWYLGNSGNQSHPVGRKQPNRWGLYDTHGNVSEWCAKRPGGDTPGSNSPQLDGEEKALRDLRGGSWGLNAGDCRSASRLRNAGTYRYFDLGLRVVCELGGK